MIEMTSKVIFILPMKNILISLHNCFNFRSLSMKEELIDMHELNYTNHRHCKNENTYLTDHERYSKVYCGPFILLFFIFANRAISKRQLHFTEI